MPGIGTPATHRLPGRCHQSVIHQPLQGHSPGTQRRLQQKPPVRLEGSQQIAPLEQAAATLEAPGQRRPVAVAMLHQIGGMQGEGLRLPVLQPAETSPRPGQVDQSQPVPGGPLQRLSLLQERQQGSTIASLTRLQPIAPGTARVGIESQQPRGIEVPALSIPLGTQPQQDPNQVVPTVHLPVLSEPLGHARPVMLAGRQRQHRGKAGAQSPCHGTTDTRPEHLGTIMYRQPLAEALPGDAITLVLESRQCVTGLRETIVTTHPTIGTSRSTQCLQPGIQVTMMGDDLTGQPMRPGTRLTPFQPPRGTGQCRQFQCPQQPCRVGIGTADVQGLQQPPAELAAIRHRQGRQARTGVLGCHAERVGIEGPVTQHQLLGPPGVQEIDQGSPRSRVARAARGGGVKRRARHWTPQVPWHHDLRRHDFRRHSVTESVSGADGWCHFSPFPTRAAPDAGHDRLGEAF